MISMDNREFAELFLGLTAFDYEADVLQNWIDDPETVSEESLGVQRQFLTVESVKFFLRDISAMKRRVKWAIQRYWDECFKKEWPALETYFEGVARKEELSLQDGSYAEYIENLHPDLQVKDDMIIFNKEPSYKVPIKQIRKLVIVLSVFTSPHLSGNFVGDRLDIAKNLNFHSVKIQEDIPSDMYRVLYAAGDPTRLKIMKILWNSDATTSEMAEILELSPSTVSLHLKILKDSNLVESNKIKKFVYYKLKKEPFLSLQENLIHYLQY